MFTTLILSTVLFAHMPSAPTAKPCSNIVHIGDSITAHSFKYQKVEYARIGYPRAIISAHGSRSVFDKLPNDDFTGIDAVKYWKARTDRNACWVIALGTNDSGFIKYGDTKGRVYAVMNQLRGRRVLWINVWKGTGRGNNSSAKKWNRDLENISLKYKNMEILDWAKIASKKSFWLNPDRIHYNMVGSKSRALIIANKVKSLWAAP